MKHSAIISRKGGQGGIRERKKFRAEVDDLLGRSLAKVLVRVIPVSEERRSSSRKAEEWNSVNNSVFLFLLFLIVFFNSCHLLRSNYVTKALHIYDFI